MAGALLDEVGASGAAKRLIEATFELGSAPSAAPVIDAAVAACAAASRNA